VFPMLQLGVEAWTLGSRGVKAAFSKNVVGVCIFQVFVSYDRRGETGGRMSGFSVVYVFCVGESGNVAAQPLKRRPMAKKHP